MPVRILNHISRQLRLAPVLSLERPERPATETEQQQRLRDYLRFQTFDERARVHLEDQLRSQVAQGVLPAELFRYAEDLLRFSKTILPPPSTLERIVSSVAASGRQEILRQVAARLTPAQREAIDGLLEVGESDSRSTLFQLKEYPPEARPASIRIYVERSFLLASLGSARSICAASVRHCSITFPSWRESTMRRPSSDSPPTSAMPCWRVFSPTRKRRPRSCHCHARSVSHDVVSSQPQLFRAASPRFSAKSQTGVATLLEAMEILLDSQPSGEEAFRNLYRQVEEPALRAAMEDCREFKRLEESGYQEELRSRYSHLRRYFPAFLKLPFKGEPGTKHCCGHIAGAGDE